MARKRRASTRPAAAKKRRSGGLRKEEEEEEEEGECGGEAVAGRSCATAAARAAPGRGVGGQRCQRALGKDGHAGWRAVVIGCANGCVVRHVISAVLSAMLSAALSAGLSRWDQCPRSRALNPCVPRARTAPHADKG